MKHYSLSSTFDATYILVNDDGQLLSAGSNECGQLGNNTRQNSRILTETNYTGTIKAIAAGYRFSLLLNGEGKVFTWGSNYNGRLGVNNPDDHYSALIPQETQGINEKVSHIAAGMYHSLVLTHCGKVYVAGRNTLNELGIEEIGESSSVFREVKFSAKSSIPIRLIATGLSHNFALTADDELYAWGWNKKGQLGLGHKEEIKKPVRVNLSFPAKDIISIVGGYDFSILLTRSGEVYTCGCDDNGQLGRNGESSQFECVGNLENIEEISAGDGHWLALNKWGQVFGLGSNGCSQIDSSYIYSFSKPKPIISNYVVAIHCVGFMSILLTHDGAQYHIERKGEEPFFGEEEIPRLEEVMIKQSIDDAERRSAERDNRLTGVKKVSQFNDASFFFSPIEERNDEVHRLEIKLYNI
jgi:alpha-tubulin suppressor-like RCC1 family protein